MSEQPRDLILGFDYTLSKVKPAATLLFAATLAGCATLPARPAGMTVDEKIGQLFVYVTPGPFMNEESPRYRELLRQVRENHVGGVHWATWSNVFETAFVNRRLQRSAPVHASYARTTPRSRSAARLSPMALPTTTSPPTTAAGDVT